MHGTPRSEGTVTRLGRIAAVGLATMLLASPAHEGLARTVIDARHLLPSLSFDLEDQSGRPVTQADYRGQVVLLVFGYSGCGTSCPLVVTRLVRAVRDSGVANARILFVTVTPRSDSPAVLRTYLQGYGSDRLTGLTGAPARLEDLARRLRAAFPVLSASPPVHSESVYLFDPRGQATAVITPDTDEKALVRLIRQVDR